MERGLIECLCRATAKLEIMANRNRLEVSADGLADVKMLKEAFVVSEKNLYLSSG